MLEFLRSEWCGGWGVLVVPARDWGRRNARPSGGGVGERWGGCAKSYCTRIGVVAGVCPGLASTNQAKQLL